ncbi:tetratricopeptide repeat-containing sensor histidine kinase [Chryseobacterium sp. SL1]|uniref:tetratricopeptide repeat-containing sensor histidine kinase n=1 Tax=Chryseobacterium sp. SL1 TaxID=2995159 RepID=UPI002275580C|nr:tetratricopeptide repeat-containing sensor histidine kinase [Chryseobacterium sp. SL1]MCY1659596.1 tetratricopeptide repeat protein [Chryseobacterium sp. SL1]
MKNLLVIFTLFLIFSCKKEKQVNINPPTNKYFERAVIFKKNNSDSAFYYFNLSKNDFLEKNDSLGAARALVNMALIQYDKGDFYGSIETSLTTNKFLKSQDNIIAKKIFASSYNNIANASNNLRSYDSAIVYYKKAIKSTDKDEDKYTCYNNIGDVLITQKKFKLAKEILEKAVLADSAVNYSRALNNLAKAKYLDNISYNPLPEFHKALAIRQKINDRKGLNSSFETLLSYYFDKDKKLSLEYARKMLEEAKKNNSPDDQITALKRIITLDPPNYLRNFEKLDSINEYVQTSRNKHKSQFAMVRYDVEQKDAENKNLKLKNLEDDNKILILLGTLILLVLIIVFLRKRQKQLKQEKELEVKNTQLKMSKKVHDVVANGIYQVMAKIENQEDFDRDKTLDELEFVYEKSRNLSYEKAGEEKEFSQEISELIASFNNASVKTFTAGNSSSIWTNISAPVKEEVYQVLRELMVNMKKHSNASHVAVKFEKVNQNIEIQYKDNGVGISGDLIYKNGLRNTASRIEGIGGNITFETKIEKGLKVNISFPSS